MDRATNKSVTMVEAKTHLADWVRDLPIARVFGELQAELEDRGTPLADADLQIAATARHFGLVLVTGNLRHFRRIPGLRFDEILSRARSQND